jgi:YegS/Rv2252/BmrU family lipid kinase
MRALFIVNRRSGARRRRDVARVIRETCPWDYGLAESERKEDLDWIIAEAAAANVDVVYAVGGDGTVHEVAKRLIGKSPALGVLPTGSGNGFARHIGLPMDPRRSLQACARMRIEEIDTATVNGIPFVGTMGIGFDAWVAEQFASSTVRGLRTYAAIAFRGFFGYHVEEYDITIDGRPQHRPALIIAIANASQYGNNARIAPLASLQDGMLDVVLVDRLSPFAIPSAGMRLFRGTLDGARGVSMERGKRVVIRRPAAGPAHLDGEPFSLPAELTIEVAPRSLRVLLPDSVDRV